MSKFSVRKPLTIFVSVLAVVILGIVALTKMTPDLLPNMNFPYVVVMTTYPGASPETVEEEVTKPMEQSMATLEHIKSVTSTSSENYSLVMLEFEDSVNLDTVGVDIQQNISTLSAGWSDSVGTPYVLKINPSMLPVAVTAVSMEGMDIIELTDFVENTLMQDLEGTAGVASITTSGAVESQVHVLLSQSKIDALNDRMESAVNQKLDDAKADLEETKAELEDAKSQLEDAEAQLDSGKETLVDQTSSAQAQLNSKQVELLETKIQLQQKLVSATETKTQLDTQLSTLQSIADQIASLETKKTELEDGIAALEQNIAETESTIAALESALAELDATLSSLNGERAAAQTRVDEAQQAVDAYGETPPTPDEEGYDAYHAALEELSAAREELSSVTGEITDATLSQAEKAASLAGLKAALPELESSLTTAQTALSTVTAGLATVDAQLSAQGMTRETLTDTIAQLRDGIAQAQAGIDQLTDTIAQLDAGTIQISEALSTLSGSTSAGLLELADAAAQITMNTTTVTSALEQVESGLEQIEDSRADALSAADIGGTLTLDTVASLLGAQNFSMPAGYVEENGVRWMVSVGDEIPDMDALSDLLLFDTGEDAIGPIYLSDVADIFVTDTSEEAYARLGSNAGLMLSFEKQSNAATAEVCDALDETFDELESKYEGLSFVTMMDQGSYIYMIVMSILESLLAGAIFSVLILFLFLRDIRPTVITLLSIPISVLFAIALMYFSGVTLNMISLSGLSIAVGMLVDNSIVVIENIYRLKAKGATAAQAAVAGAKQVAGAITASTLTTVCVFLPIVFVEGITRQLFVDLALTMGYALMASLIIALTLVPAMAKGLLADRPEKEGRRPRRHAAAAGTGRGYRAYRKTINWALDHKAIVLTAAVVLLVVSAVGALSRGFSFMPDIDMNTVSLSVAMPEDATMESASATADEIIARIQTLDNVDSVGAMMGGSTLLSSGSSSYDVTIYVTLPEGDSGKEAGAAIAALCQDLDCDLSYSSTMVDMSMLTGSGVSLYLYGNSMDDLQAAALTAEEALASVDGLTDIQNGLQEAEDAYHVSIDKNAAMEKGWTVAQIYMQIASSLTSSATAMTLDVDSTTADVLVEEESTLTPEELMDLTFTYTDADGNDAEFALRDVAELEQTMSLTSISRSDQRRYLNVTATVADGYTLTNVSRQAQEAIAAADLPASVTYEFSGENETVMEAVSQLLLMLLLGLVLVYFIMVAQFQSLKSPFIVMFTIPLAFTGGFLALLLFGMDVSIIALIGFVMLMGIIVNNGIVLIEYVNQLRADGVDRRQALVEAGVTRLRPILMTSLTTILGLIVMAIGQDVGTALMQPVAVVCIGGLVYATAMTLLVVPCIYDMMNKKEITVLTDEDLEFHEL